MYVRFFRSFARRRAVVGVMTALALTALMGMVAFSLDLGSVVLASQRAQSVADMAAAAAAQTQVPGASTSVALACVSALIAGNNAPTGPQITWQSGKTTFYPAGATVPSYGTLTSSQSAVQVITHLPVAFNFARALGLTGTTVTRQATALRQECPTLPCLFAAGTPSSSLHGITYNGSGQIIQNGDVWSNAQILMNGSAQSIQGNAHADSSFSVTGSNQTISGPAQWVTQWTLTGSNESMSPVRVASSPESYPVTYTTSSFGTYTYDLPSYTLNGSNLAVPPGTYRVHGNVLLNGTNITLAGVTFVADGTITLNGSGFGPASPAAANGVLLWTSSTSASAILVNGASGNFQGIIDAPNGGVTFNGSSQCVKNGSIMGQTILVNGSGWQINPSPNLGVGVQVSLIG